MRTIAELIRWRARRHPSLQAWWYEGKSQTYGELDESSSALAGGLVAQLGLAPGDRVAILDKNCAAYLELLFALDKAGIVAAPLNWRLTPLGGEPDHRRRCAEADRGGAGVQGAHRSVGRPHHDVSTSCRAVATIRGAMPMAPSPGNSVRRGRPVCRKARC